MSSYWGHGGRDERAKERKRSFRRSRQSVSDRRASLPCMSQLEVMRLKNPSTPPHFKSNEEQKEVHSHPHARRTSSDEHGRIRGGGAESGGGGTVPELAESFNMTLHFRNHRVSSLTESDNACLICHEETPSRGRETGRGQELHCPHRFHKEVRRTDQASRQRSRSSAAVCENRKELPFCSEQEEYQLPRPRRSLRRQR